MNKKEIPNIVDKNYYLGLDTLRAFSLILVVISHIFFNDGGVIDKLNLGSIGVDIFFVMSGFLITTLICKEIATSGQFDLRAFFIRRAFRILPVVFLFTLALFFLNHFYSLNISNNSLISGLLFYGNLSFAPKVWHNGHLWSLSVEEQFYLLFPTMFFLIKKTRYLKFLFLFLFLIPIFNYLHYNSIIHIGLLHQGVALFANIFSYATFMIIVGSIAALLVFMNERCFEFIYGLKNKSFFSVIILLLVIFLVSKSVLINVLLGKLIFGIGVLSIILLNLSRAKKDIIFWDNPILVYLGKLSYSLYIWQQIFTHQQPWGGSVLPNVICLLLVSMVSYHFVEIKFIKLRKSLGY